LFARIKRAASSGGGLLVVLVLANGSGERSLREEGLKGGGKDETPKMPTAAGKILH
jgi:hypothetical protein